MGSINLKDAEEARDAITEAQKKEIANMYESFSKDLSYEANKFKATATNPSAALVNMQKKELSKMLRTTSKKVTEEVNGKIIQNMTNVSSAVASSNQKWLESLGFPQGGIQAVLSNVPDSVVRNIISGNIYEGGWNLSKAIWGDREVFLKDAYSIVAGGIAENKSIYEISKKLESYVSPSAKKQWNLKMADGRRIYPKKVDYNAQRLARTLSQHAYQQSILAINKKNPFILGYRWHATGSRACPICEARDGVIYSEDDLPMDHPNGMCIMEPVTDPNMDDRLAAWAKGADDPAIDAYAERFGYSQKEAIKKTKDGVGTTASKKVTKEAVVPSPNATVTSTSKPVAKAKKAVVYDEKWIAKNLPKNMFSDLNGEHAKQDFINYLNNAPESYKKAIVKASNKVKNFTYSTNGGYWQARNRVLSTDMTQEYLSFMSRFSDTKYQTILHELGHTIDSTFTQGVKQYTSKKANGFIDAMMDDLTALAKDFKRGGPLGTEYEKSLAYRGGIGISDALSGALNINKNLASSFENYTLIFSHDDAYWTRGNVKAEMASELFANINASVGCKDFEAMKRYFPKAVEEYGKIIELYASKGI